jgi:hypothetical protein
MYDHDGNLKINVTIPNCLQIIRSDAGAVGSFVAMSKYFIYVACENLITQVSSNDGSIVRQFGMSESLAISSETTEKSFFILF